MSSIMSRLLLHTASGGLPIIQSIVQEERGLPFQVGSAFYRRQSALARDLGVLMAAVHAKQTGSLRVIDAMSGCGVRASRYLHQAGADFVWANDACPQLFEILKQNLCQGGGGGAEELERWRVTHEDANKLLLGCAIREDYFDLIDVDSFGSDSFCLGPALGAVKFGGLVYATSTDGFSSGGHRPHNSLAAYGAFVRRMPYANEMGLRMLIGGAVREAATRNMNVVPVFSNYSSHGPVFRTMLRVQPGKLMINRNYGFIIFCNFCGESQHIQWEDLGRMTCHCEYKKKSASLVVSGPLWIGPLHNRDDIMDICEMAKQWAWIKGDKVTKDHLKLDYCVDKQALEELVEVMLGESQPTLPCGFIELSEISKRGKLQTPKRTDFINALQQRGYVASRSHIEPNAVKTNCSMQGCIELAQSMQ